VKRITTILLAGTTALVLAGVAIAKGPPAQLKVHTTSVGKILVNRAGFTVYEFTRDRGKHNSCILINNCPSAWPALTTSRQPLAGAGVNRKLLGTITLAGGVKQVTYAGHPLYTFVDDHNPGEANGNGSTAFGGEWNALQESGAPAQAAAGAGESSSSSEGSGESGGYGY